MGLKILLIEKIGEKKTTRLLALIGGFIIFIVSTFPMSTLIQDLALNSIWGGYLTVIWSAFIITLSSVIIIFFGQSAVFPTPTLPDEIKEVIEEPSSIDPKIIVSAKEYDTSE